MSEWPPHIHERPMHPLRVAESPPSGWVCRCGINDMGWRHRERPHADTMCRGCFDLMSEEGICWDVWCKRAREGLPWSPSSRPDSPRPRGAVSTPMAPNPKAGGYFDRDVPYPKRIGEAARRPPSQPTITEFHMQHRKHPNPTVRPEAGGPRGPRAVPGNPRAGDLALGALGWFRLYPQRAKPLTPRP